MFLDGLESAWWSPAIPGVRPHSERFATYSAFSLGELPPMPPKVTDGYAWLASSSVPKESSMATPASNAILDISRWSDVIQADPDLYLPADFEKFARDPDLRRYLRSATNCYFDPASHAVAVPGGRLVHFLSDSQWIRHWLMYVGVEGGQTIVTTDFPVGFDLTPEDLEVNPGDPYFEICAPTFLEFMWR